MCQASTNQTTLEALEWNRLLQLAQELASTEPGKTLLLDLQNPNNWAKDLDLAKFLQQETQEVTALLDRNTLWDSLSGLTTPEQALNSLDRQAVLDLGELNLLRKWLYAVDCWVQTPRDEIRGEYFKRALNALSDPHEPLRILERVLTPEGELSESATPKLASLYADIRGLRKEIAHILDNLLRVYTQKGIVQENFSDIRDGRYVLPIKISHQSEIDGIIYEASSSRQTVFIEPKEVASLNNKLRQRQNDLMQEIFTILQEVSKHLAPYTGEIRSSTAILAHWDAVHAKARLGLHYGGKPISVTGDRSFLLHQTAHPLLWWALPHKLIVRNEIDFTEPARTLLLTGPNTGGKTVLLKTLGIAAICARTGFPFPGTDHLCVPFFDSVFADLGDSQSIEHHISSFSGHIIRFKEILSQMTERSLVLLDELNTATDPGEGAALGRAFLEIVMNRGSMVIATTHDPHLKALSTSNSQILTASMAFDELSRSPTYRIILGVPGRSRALETAERLGLAPEVLTLAKQYLTQEHLGFEKLLSQLEKDVQETERAKKEAVASRDEAERLRREWTEKTRASITDALDRTRQKLRRIMEQAQDEIRSSVRKLDEMKNRRDLDHTRGQVSTTFTQAATRIDTALAEEAPELANTLELQPEAVTRTEATDEKIKIGSKVRIPRWKSTGVVLDIQGDKVKVSMGTIQMTLPIRDTEPLDSPTLSQKTHIIDLDRPPPPPAQLDLRGIRLEEAMANLERYLDQAYRSESLKQVIVIHGLGTGALREGTRKLLQTLPYIKEFKDGGSGQGGAGATVVEFDL